MSRFRFTAILLGVIALQSAGLEAQRPPALRTLASFKNDSIQEFAVSPNGRFILIGTKTKLRMYNAASRQSWDLVDGNAVMFAWSPQGDRIAWNLGIDLSHAYVWVMPVDANTGKARGAAQRLTTGLSAMAAFSPDGRWIAYGSGDLKLQQMWLAMTPATGGPERIVAPKLAFEGIAWGAGGGSIFVNGAVPAPANVGVLKIRVDGGAKEVLPTQRGEYLIGATATGRYLILSRTPMYQSVATGQQATIADTAGHVVGHVPLPPGKVFGWPGIVGDSALVWVTTTDRSMLEARPVAGGPARRLPPVGESNSIPRWSPDGKRIAFNVESASRTSLAVMNADGTHARTYKDVDVFLADVQWSPDSRALAFLHPDAVHMSVLDVAAGTTRAVLDDTSRGGWRWRADGKAIVFRSRRKPGAGIYEVTLDGQSRQLLDWPMPTPNIWRWVGDSSLFVRSDSAAVLRPIGPGPARRLASVPPGGTLVRLVEANDGRWVAGLLAHHEGGAWVGNQVELFSLATGDRKVLDLPFNWLIGSEPFGGSNPPVFLPGDNALLVFGRRNGDAGIKLFRVPLDGGAPSVFADVGTPLPDGEMFTASVSPDGKSVVYSVHPEPPTRSLVLIDLRGAIPGTSRQARK